MSEINKGAIVCCVSNTDEIGSVVCSHGEEQKCCKWLMDCMRCKDCPMTPYTIRTELRKMTIEEFEKMFPHFNSLLQ